jgi:hypothetical protein
MHTPSRGGTVCPPLALAFRLRLINFARGVFDENYCCNFWRFYLGLRRRLQVHSECSAMKTIDCHDCTGPVSLNARQCPHCGSTAPSGPYRPRAPHKFRIEERNDRGLVLTSLALGTLGACYGYATSASALGALFATFAYGFLGILIGVPIGFVINFLRN